MAKIIINELGQKVRLYEWDEWNRRLSARKYWKGEGDLNGKDLVIRHTWGLGDVLYSTPALRGLKEKFPDVRIHYICMFPEILDHNPDVFRAYHWSDYENVVTVELGEALEKEWYFLDYDVPLKGGYDYKIHLRTKPKLNEHLVQLLKANPKDLSDDEKAFVDQASTSVITRYKMIALDMYCWHAFVEPQVKTVYYYPTPQELELARRFMKPMRSAGKKVIAIMPYSSSKYKDYPHWKEVMKLLPQEYMWLIMDSKNKQLMWTGKNIFDCSGAFSLRQAAAIIIEADLCCCSDTGLVYTRLARGGKAVMTYGPHEPQPFLHYFQPQAHGLRISKLERTKGMEGMCSVGCYIDTTTCHTPDQPAPCLDELTPLRVAAEIQLCLEK
jgi:ADP-heptose:LPS heptosyltransferase